MIIADRGGHTKACTGASDVIDELTEDRLVINRVNELLKAQGHTIVWCQPSENEGWGEWNIGVRICNNSNAEIFFSIHFNSSSSGNAFGCEVVTSSLDKKILPFANRVLSNLESLGFTNRGIKINDELAETVCIDIATMIIEVCFVHSKDAAIYKNAGVEKVARAIANGIDQSILLNVPNIAPKIIHYQGHIQNIGWQEIKSNDEICGTTGQSLRLEALMIAYPGVKFRAHIENLGWTNYRESGEMIGTMNSSLRIEAIEILSDKLEFSVHIEGIGWTNYGKNCISGTTGQSKRIEAIKIREL